MVRAKNYLKLDSMMIHLEWNADMKPLSKTVHLKNNFNETIALSEDSTIIEKAKCLRLLCCQESSGQLDFSVSQTFISPYLAMSLLCIPALTKT